MERLYELNKIAFDRARRPLESKSEVSLVCGSKNAPLSRYKGSKFIICIRPYRDLNLKPTLSQQWLGILGQIKTHSIELEVL